MIEKFGCDTLLFSGVAGGINPKLQIGDLIIADKLCQHDLDITAFGHPNGFVPGGKVFVETTKSLREVAIKVANENNIKVIEELLQLVISLFTQASEKTSSNQLLKLMH